MRLSGENLRSIGAAAGIVLLLAACGGDDDGSSAGTTESLCIPRVTFCIDTVAVGVQNMLTRDPSIRTW